MKRHRFRELVISSPFELFVSLLCTVAGLPVLFGAVSPTSLSAALPPWALLVWGGCLSAGGIFSLIGLLMRTGRSLFLPSLQIERAGVSLIASATLTYSVTIMFYAELSRSLVAVAINTALALACIGRAYAIRRIVMEIQKGAR